MINKLLIIVIALSTGWCDWCDGGGGGGGKIGVVAATHQAAEATIAN